MTDLHTEMMIQMHTLWLEYQKEFFDLRDKLESAKQKSERADKEDASSNLTVKECSEYLRQTKRTTYNQILSGKIDAKRVGNKYIIPKKQFL